LIYLICCSSIWLELGLEAVSGLAVLVGSRIFNMQESWNMGASYTLSHVQRNEQFLKYLHLIAESNNSTV